MLATIKGIYDKGKIIMIEEPPVKNKTEVFITFLIEHSGNISTEEKESFEHEHLDWNDSGIKHLEKAYNDNEPDIDQIKVNEPNPHYNPWKQAK